VLSSVAMVVGRGITTLSASSTMSPFMREGNKKGGWVRVIVGSKKGCWCVIKSGSRRGPKPTLSERHKLAARDRPFQLVGV
jgi:hypothetical protein